MTSPLSTMFNQQQQNPYRWVDPTGTGRYNTIGSGDSVQQGDEIMSWDTKAMGFGDEWDPNSFKQNQDGTYSISRKDQGKGNYITETFNRNGDTLDFVNRTGGNVGDWTMGNLRGTAFVGLGALGGMGLNSAGIGGTNIAAGAGGATGLGATTAAGAAPTAAAAAPTTTAPTVAGGATTAAGGGGLGSLFSGGGGTAGTVANLVGRFLGGGGTGGGGGGGISNLSELLNLYSNERQSDRFDEIENKLATMYGADSPYAKNMRNELERRDSAAGRASQYGPREVELQAKLADSYGKNVSNLMNVYGIQQNALNGQLGSLARLFQGNGGNEAVSNIGSWLSTLFGGGMTPNSGSNPEFNPVSDGWTTDPMAGP